MPSRRDRIRSVLQTHWARLEKFLLSHRVIDTPSSQRRHACRQVVRWATHRAQLSDLEFRRRYRMTPLSFRRLCDKLRKHVRQRNTGRFKARARSRGGEPEITEPELEVELACTLRFLAGGMPLDLKLIYGFSTTNLYRTIWKIVDAINSAFPISFPTDIPSLRKLEAGFRRPKYPWWRGQVGSIDGVLFAQKSPGKAVINPMQYYVERKSMYALLCMAICDSKMRVTWFDISHEPKTHDSLAFRGTTLGHLIENGGLPGHFFLNGDAAFSHGKSMVCPIGECGFDYVQSGSRIGIEQTFGLIIRRWGILWRPLEVLFERRVDVIGACVRLHNFCINERLDAATAGVSPFLGEVYPNVSGFEEVLPGQWELPPFFDDDGRPLCALDTEGQHAARQRARAGTSSAAGVPTRARQLADAANKHDVLRPYVRGGRPVRRYQKKIRQYLEPRVSFR